MMILRLSFAFAELDPILSQMSIIIPHFSPTIFSLVAFSAKPKKWVVNSQLQSSDRNYI